jgi:biotin carboxyl carrier protein
MPLMQTERQGILLAAAATAAQRPEGSIRLRISFEGKSYDVEVERLSGITPTPGTEPEMDIPESVLAPPLEPDIRDEDRICRSPIAGAIVVVQAEAGHWLRKDDPVAVIEAMKMQIDIGAPVDGFVEEVSVAPGDAVKPGQVLCRLS